MALRHRTVQRFDAGERAPEATFELARQAIQEWLDASKNPVSLPAQLGTRIIDIGSGYRASFQRIEHEGAHVARWKLTVGSAPHIYLTTVTVLQDSNSRQNWLWYDVESSRDDSHFHPPRLTFHLTHALGSSPRDRISGFTEGLRIVRAADVGRFLDEVLEAEDRAVPALISGSDRWSYQDEEHVEKALAPLYGLATFWKLDVDAFTEFNSVVRPGYRVFPGSIHSYQFGLDTNNDLDSRRHWWFSPAEVQQSTARDLSRRLHLEAMRSGVLIPLPVALRPLNEAFERAASRNALAFFDALLPETRVQHVQPRPGPAPSPSPSPSPSILARIPAPQMASRARAEGEIEKLLSEAAAEFGASAPRSTGIVETLSMIFGAVRDQLRTLRDSFAHQQAVTNIKVQIDSLVDEKIGLEKENDELNALLGLQDEEARESGEILLQQREIAHREQLRADHLASELARLSALQQVDVSWAVPAASAHHELFKVSAPETVRDLFAQIEQLAHVVYSGDTKPSESITDAKLRDLILRDAWIFARELELYARQYENEDGIQGLQRYIRDRSTSVTPAQYANDETSNVRNTPKFSKPRIFPVPEVVSPDCRIFMGAHFRLTQDNGKAMRMHLHDATAVDGKVYIGYLGPHLPSRMTS